MKKPNATVTLEIDVSMVEKMKAFYAESLQTPPNEYVAFLAKLEEVSITCYNKVKNGKVKVVFQGPKSVYESSIWGEGTITRPTPKKPTVFRSTIKEEPFSEQVGSDEVGTGDFFGPIVVCAAYCDEIGLSKLNLLGVTDSKKLSDDYIREIGPKLLENFDFSILALDNEKYNEVHAKGLNMNAIKAKMHNAALHNVSSRHPSAKICQDQFAEPDLYYSYLVDEKIVVRNIEFSTKGELVYPSVALASCIARYHFLRKMEKLEEELGEKIPLGAGTAVDEFALRIRDKYGLDALRKLVKANFANFKKIKEQ